MTTSHDPLSGARPPITITSNILHCVSIPTYAAELGVDPLADFVNRLESQGLLGSVVFMFSFICISGFRPTHTLRATGYTY